MSKTNSSPKLKSTVVTRSSLLRCYVLFLFSLSLLSLLLVVENVWWIGTLVVIATLVFANISTSGALRESETEREFQFQQFNCNGTVTRLASTTENGCQELL